MATRLALRDLNSYASRNVTNLTLKKLIGSDVGALKSQRSKDNKKDQILQSAQLLHREIPIRLAKRIGRLSNFPDGFSDSIYIKRAQQQLFSSIHQLSHFPFPKDSDIERSFMLLHSTTRAKHQNMFVSLSKAMVEFNNAGKNESPALTAALDEYHASRLQNRMLVDHHFALHTDRDGWHGIVELECNPSNVVRNVIADIAKHTNNVHGRCPTLSYMNGSNKTLTYIPSQLHFMVGELLKNAVHATLDKYSEEEALPDIQVKFRFDEKMIVEITDSAGGIRPDIDDPFQYSCSTSRHTYDPLVKINPTAGAQVLKVGRDHDVQKPVKFNPPLPNGWVWTPQGPQVKKTTITAHLGYGLPVSRQYARLFGGDLHLNDRPGEGVTAKLLLPRIGESHSFAAL